MANGQIGTAYSQTLTASGGTLPYTFGIVGTLPAGLSLDPVTGEISGTPTAPAGTASFTVTVSDARSCSDVVALSITTSALPVCSLTATATPDVCNTATNQYIVTGSVSSANAAINSASPQSLTISDGMASAVVTLTGNGPVSYTLTGLLSDGLTHTVTMLSSATACGMTSVDYTAPASCTVAAPLLTLSVDAPVCNPATNQYTATGTVSLTNVPSGTTLTITDNGAVVSTATLTAGQTSASFSVSGLSNASSHTVMATLTGGTSATTTYTAPASCTVCSLSLTTMALNNGQIGTAYSQTLTASGGTLPYTFAVLGTLPAGLSLDPVTGVLSGTPTAPAGTASFTVTVSDAKSCSDTQPLTITTSALPVCSLTATATPGTCNTLTNQYTVTGIVSATNAAINGASTQSLTISVGSITTTVTFTGNGPVSYTLSGLNSDGTTHTVMVLSSATACGMTSVDYAAPASCTVAAPVLTVQVSTPVCNSATNNYTATGTVSLTNAVAGTLTITDNGASLTIITVTAGQTTASFSVSGVSNTASHTVVATLTGGTSASTVYTAPVACTVCSTSITTTALANGQVGTAYSQTITATGGTAPYTFTLLGNLPNGLSLSSSGVISGTPTSAATSSFTVRVSDAKSCLAVKPLTITVSALPVCSLTATATPGTCNTLTNQYTVTGIVSSTNAAINSASPQTLTVSVGSVNTLVTLTGNGPVSYTLAGLSSDGVVHTVTVMSSATACGMTSMTYTAPASCTVACPAPITVCQGSTYAFQLDGPTGQSSYQWYRDGQLIAGATTTSFTATQAGSYSLVINGNTACVNGSCCPIVIVETAAPSFSAVAVAPTCSGATSLTNGQITLTGLGSFTLGQFTYQYVVGSVFDPATAGLATNVPLNGLVLNKQSGGETITIRVTNGQTGCYADQTVMIPQANCQCPPPVCLPFVIKRTR